eukprot:5792282-Prymnesium_polylepis.1
MDPYHLWDASIKERFLPYDVALQRGLQSLRSLATPPTSIICVIAPSLSQTDWGSSLDSPLIGSTDTLRRLILNSYGVDVFFLSGLQETTRFVTTTWAGEPVLIAPFEPKVQGREIVSTTLNFEMGNIKHAGWGSMSFTELDNTVA